MTAIGPVCDDEGTLELAPIAALVAASMLAQIGQYGVGFIVLPLWLTRLGWSAAMTGLFASLEWGGMLAGIALAPRIIGCCGFGRTACCGLLVSMAGFGALATSAHTLVLPGASLIGFGMGLRWIGLETPLFRGTPARMRGRIIGLHELLVAGAAMIGPMLERLTELGGVSLLMTGGFFVAAAVLPMTVTMRWRAMQGAVDPLAAATTRRTLPSTTMRAGALMGLIAGLCNGALYGLLPQFAHARAVAPEMTSALLVNAGIGSALAQYPVGWLADRFGLVRSALVLGSVSFVSSVVLLAVPVPSFLMLAVLLLAGAIRALLTLATYGAAVDDRGRADHNMQVIARRFSMGALLGPIGAGTAMSIGGMNMLPIWLVVLSGALVLYLSTMLLAIVPSRSAR